MSDEEMIRIYDTYSKAVYRAAYAYCRNSADAEDITQETFIKRFQTDAVFPDEKSEKAWLMRGQSFFQIPSVRSDLSMQPGKSGL